MKIPYYIDHIIIASLITGASYGLTLFMPQPELLLACLVGMVTYISREVAQWEMKKYWDYKGLFCPVIFLTVLYIGVLYASPRI